MIAAQNWEGWGQGPDLPHCPGQQPSVEDALTSLAHWVVVRAGERVIRDGQCLRLRVAPEDKNEISREVIQPGLGLLTVLQLLLCLLVRMQCFSSPSSS